jgi:glycine C-acetyltransferase
MVQKVFSQHLNTEIEQIKEAGLYKTEVILASPQQIEVKLSGGQTVINFCANNYLGLANHPYLIEEAKTALGHYGFGLSSVRFICGTQIPHKTLEYKISLLVGTEDTILFSSCFDANGGLFESLFTQEDAIISDALNHASIIDGIRLCKAARYRYKNNDMEDLEKQLVQASESGARFKVIATDGVFSMDGVVASLDNICDLAQQYDAMVMIDDCHATGFLGEHGRGSHEYKNVLGRVDIITGTFGKALGGASGGFISGRKTIIDYLRQRSRPYLFSNSLAPMITAATLKALEIIERDGHSLRSQLFENTIYFRESLQQAGFNVIPGFHPIVPVMIGDAIIAQKMSALLIEMGVYVISFSYPVVPKGKARIRVQLSAIHERHHLDRAINGFIKVGKQLKLIP